MDGQGQAPTAMPPLEAGQTSDNINATSIDAATAPIPSLEPAAVSTVSPTPAAPLTDLASTTSDRPDGPNGPESAAEPETVKEPFLEKQEVAEPVQAPLTNGSSLPPTAPAAETHTTTLNANAVNEAGEAEHAARVEQEAKVETAILEADKVKQEQDDDLARQRTPLTDLSLLQTNAATDAGGRDTPQSPPSPSSTSALSSVTASAAPSVAKVTPSSQSVKDPKEDEEGSESGQPADADKKPRSTGGRSTARRAASNASLRDTAASSTTSTRRSEKPASSSSATGANGTRTRGTSAQGGQPQRQSSRSKTTTATSERTSNTRPRMRQRGSPDPKDGNDTTPGTRRSRRTRQSTAQNGRANGEDDDSDDGDEGVTRCICGNNDDETLAFMIQCDTCKAWQHGPCVGFKHEADCPDTYYCEQCRPELHPSLSSSRGKKHARSVSASGRPSSYTGIAHSKDETEELGRSTASNKPVSRDHRELSTTSLPATGTAATSSGHPSYHRARSSADAALISSFLDTSQHSPSPASPGSPGSNQGSSDGGTKRPMYPPTSHFAAPQNPKRRSTMNSRDSAAFDESILLATQQAFRESRAMAIELGVGSSKGRKRKKRDDDDMEPVKEEEEDHSDDDSLMRRASESQERAMSRSDVQENGNIDPALANHEDEGEGEEDGDEHDDMSGDANGSSAPRKRRRRCGAGALFTAPNKKRAASARAKKPTTEDIQSPIVEELSVNAMQYDGPAASAEEEANARKRKRDDANGEEDRPARAASPTASHDTSASSHSSSDKPLAQGNKRRKASPTAEDSSNNPTATTQVVSNILGSTLQVAIPTASTEDSAAPSPAASAPPSNTDVEDAAKDQESHAEAVTNGLLAVVKDKRGADTDQEESTPAPTTQADDNANLSATVNGKGIKQPNQYTYKRGGPGSRGGMKGSPSKRAALAAAAEARHGKHRDETPSTYEDWVNQPPSWGLPDHLSHLSHLLPSQSPLPLQVTKFVTSPNNSTVASPVTLQGEATAPEAAQNDDSAPPTPAISVSSTLEPSAKIRFPSRRMSIAEMRKRAKSMLDYLARVQVDTVDRNNRNRALAAVQETILSSGQTLEERSITPPPSMMFSKDTPITPQAANLIDDLSRQLNSFQEKFL